MVICTLKDVAERFISKCGMVPCLLLMGWTCSPKKTKKCFFNLLVMQSSVLIKASSYCDDQQ